MKTTISILASALCSVFDAAADWTVALPEPRPGDGSWYEVNDPTEFGTVVYGWNSERRASRLIWIDASGRLLLDYLNSETSWGKNQIIVLNARQVLAGGPGASLVLLTVTNPGNFTTKTYSFSSSQRWSPFFDVSSARPIYTGFYYIDMTSWTLSRVEFPKPTETSPITLSLQSSTDPSGPWTTFGEVSTPADQPKQLFRLEVRQ